MQKTEIKRLLLPGSFNTKLRKSPNLKVARYSLYGMSLAPNTLSGMNVCKYASKECIATCLNSAGYGGIFPSVIRARINRTKLFFEDKKLFKQILFRDVANAEKLSKKRGKKLAIRLNIYSDIPWENVFPELFDKYKNCQWYDYTKYPIRNTPDNYHITFSRSEDNHDIAIKKLNEGKSVSWLFYPRIPRNWLGYRVINGDKHDCRWLDRKARNGEKGFIIGLIAKGKARRLTTNKFVSLTVLS